MQIWVNVAVSFSFMEVPFCLISSGGGKFDAGPFRICFISPGPNKFASEQKIITSQKTWFIWSSALFISASSPLLISFRANALLFFFLFKPRAVLSRMDAVCGVATLEHHILRSRIIHSTNLSEKIFLPFLVFLVNIPFEKITLSALDIQCQSTRNFASNSTYFVAWVAAKSGARYFNADT